LGEIVFVARQDLAECAEATDRFRLFVIKAPLGPGSVGMKQARAIRPTRHARNGEEKWETE
jgi:hypothetical protein